MNSFIVRTKTEIQEKAVKAILEALEVNYEKLDGLTFENDDLLLPPHVIAAVKKSEEEIANGKFYTHEEVMKMIENR